MAHSRLPSILSLNCKEARVLLCVGSVFMCVCVCVCRDLQPVTVPLPGAQNNATPGFVDWLWWVTLRVCARVQHAFAVRPQALEPAEPLLPY